MVFVTVGTHEQPFDRLMREVERLAAAGGLSDVTVQYGYSTVIPKGCRCERFLPYGEMCRLYAEADAVVCHGGPSTFLEAMGYGKVPVVVPRQAAFGEHVNDHQVAFCRQFAERVGGIEVVDDVSGLAAAIARARAASAGEIETNNAHFCEELGKRIERLIGGDGR